MTVSFLVVLVSEDAPPTCVLVHQKAAHQEHQAGAVEAAAAAAAAVAAVAAVVATAVEAVEVADEEYSRQH